MIGARMRSEILNLDLAVEQGQLRLYDHKTAQRLRTHEESEAELRAEKLAGKRQRIKLQPQRPELKRRKLR